MNKCKLLLYTVSDNYIAYLRSFPELRHIYDPKTETRSFNRPYVGVLFHIGDVPYFAPLSSPKPSDFILDSDGIAHPRKDAPSLIRLPDPYNANSVMGKISLLAMIPVPISEVRKLDIAPVQLTKSDGNTLTQEEKNMVLLFKEARAIKSKCFDIIRKAKNLYNSKKNVHTLKFIPNFVKEAIDFGFAEERYWDFIIEKSYPEIAAPDKSEHSEYVGLLSGVVGNAVIQTVKADSVNVFIKHSVSDIVAGKDFLQSGAWVRIEYKNGKATATVVEQQYFR